MSSFIWECNDRQSIPLQGFTQLLPPSPLAALEIMLRPCACLSRYNDLQNFTNAANSTAYLEKSCHAMNMQLVHPTICFVSRFEGAECVIWVQVSRDQMCSSACLLKRIKFSYRINICWPLKVPVTTSSVGISPWNGIPEQFRYHCFQPIERSLHLVVLLFDMDCSSRTLVVDVFTFIAWRSQ